MAERDVPAIRFARIGVNDSMGDARKLWLPGMQDDLALAHVQLADRAGGLRLLALRSSSLPVLAHAAAGSTPVDLVLWDPVLRGAPMVERWRCLHAEQLTGVGRYILRKPVAAADDELLGFDVDPSLLDGLA